MLYVIPQPFRKGTAMPVGHVSVRKDGSHWRKVNNDDWHLIAESERQPEGHQLLLVGKPSREDEHARERKVRAAVKVYQRADMLAKDAKRLYRVGNEESRRRLSRAETERYRTLHELGMALGHREAQADRAAEWMHTNRSRVQSWNEPEKPAEQASLF